MTGQLLRVGDNGTAAGRSLWLWCPGCEDTHRVTIDSPNWWFWDGNEQAPTVSPSILVRGVQYAAGETFHRPGHLGVAAGQPTTCHSFVRAGQWVFLADSTHALSGQTVPMVPLPEWLTDSWAQA